MASINVPTCWRKVICRTWPKILDSEWVVRPATRVQDSGTAIWLFAYFGYWLEVIIVLASRAIKGSLMSAKKAPGTGKDGPLGTKLLPTNSTGNVSPTTAKANQKAAGKSRLRHDSSSRQAAGLVKAEAPALRVCNLHHRCFCALTVRQGSTPMRSSMFVSTLAFPYLLQQAHYTTVWIHMMGRLYLKTCLCGDADLEQPVQAERANGKPAQMELAKTSS